MSKKKDTRNVRDEIIIGKHDQAITEVAKIFKRYGDEYGGFFIRTMKEMNLGFEWPWAGNPNKYKKAWIHIWNIFDSEGANEYATWVWNPYVQQHKFRSNANFYYPGDRYVDWLGFIGFNMDGHLGGRSSFSNMFSAACSYIGNTHPSKPILVTETGMDNPSYKPKWVLNAFETSKNKLPEIKGLCWQSEKWKGHYIRNFDSRIDSSPEALVAFKKGISDPYFLEKIPYNTSNS